MKMLSVFSSFLILSGVAWAGSAIGVIGQSPLTCQTDLIRSGELERVQTIVAEGGQLYFRIGEEQSSANIVGCSLHLVQPAARARRDTMECTHGAQPIGQLPVDVVPEGNTVSLSWEDDGLSYRLTLASLNGWPVLPRELSRNAAGVTGSEPAASFTEIQPSTCSVPPGF